MDVLIIYYGEPVSVPIEVADFLESDRKMMAAQGRQDRRHLSKSSFETMLDSVSLERDCLEDTVLRNLRLQNLRTATASLTADEQQLLYFRFYMEMTLEEIGERFGVSKMAISKRLKKLTQKLGDCVEEYSLPAFYIFLFIRFTKLLQVSYILRGQNCNGGLPA